MTSRTLFHLCPILILLVLLAPACRPVPTRDEQPIHVVRPGQQKPAPALSKPKNATPLKDLVAQSKPRDETMIGNWPKASRVITMDAQHEPLPSVLERFARVSRLNFVLSDDTRGHVTCVFDKVPWIRALRTVLLAKNLVAVLEGNVVRIMPRASWQEEQRHTP